VEAGLEFARAGCSRHCHLFLEHVPSSADTAGNCTFVRAGMADSDARFGGGEGVPK